MAKTIVTSLIFLKFIFGNLTKRITIFHDYFSSELEQNKFLTVWKHHKNHH